MVLIYLILIFIVSYFIGSFPSAYFITKKAVGKDIRSFGTGNVGAMNVSRATGKFYLFFLTFLADALKGAIPVYLVKDVISIPEEMILGISSAHLAVSLCAFGVVLGHCYSIYFKIKEGKFSGGKAIASLIGILWVVDFSYLFLPWAATEIIYILATGYFFLGQFMGTVFLPIIGYVLVPEYFVLSILCAIPVFIKQWPRFIPMLKGKEPKFYWKERGKKKDNR